MEQFQHSNGNGFPELERQPTSLINLILDVRFDKFASINKVYCCKGLGAPILRRKPSAWIQQRTPHRSPFGTPQEAECGLMPGLLILRTPEPATSLIIPCGILDLITAIRSRLA